MLLLATCELKPPLAHWQNQTLIPPMEKGGEEVPILNSTGNDMCMYTSKHPGELRRCLNNNGPQALPEAELLM